MVAQELSCSESCDLITWDFAAATAGDLHTAANGAPSSHPTGTHCWTELLPRGEGKDFMETQMIKPLLLVDELQLICDYHFIN